jgi:hypothetical protein
MWRWLRLPIAHFLGLGGLLFVLDRMLLAAPAARALDAPRAPIVFDRARIDEIRADYTRQTGLVPTADDEAALVDQALDDELLYREATALGLDQHDRSIRWRLIQKMQFLSDEPESGGDDEGLYQRALELGFDRDDVVIRRILVQKMRLLSSLPKPGEEPSDAELQAWYDAHRADYQQPPRVSFTHVFLSADRRGDALEADAAALGARLRAESPRPQAAVALGDHFPLSHRFEQASERHIAKLFGPEFAAGVLAIESDDWVCPVRSAYGVHCVLVTERIPPSDPPFESVRRQVVQRVRAERRERRLVDALARLRTEYALEIDSEPWRKREAR